MRALDEAIGGRKEALFDLLARGSRLPGPRPNDALVDAFAQACRGRGAPADRVAFTMARLTVDDAPGATPLEFLPMCGVAAIGARAAGDPARRESLVAELHAHADDLRFRVRAAVIGALGQVGSAAGDELVAATAPWMDGYFHAAAVLEALGRDPWLSRVQDAAGAIRRLDEAFDLARRSPRAAARFPGRKALVEALSRAPVGLAVRFGPPVFEALIRWAATDDPELRGVLSGILAEGRLISRFGQDVQRVRRALDATRPPTRNPDHDVGSTRDRSKRRRQGRGRGT
ncbi:MAG TPA: hypothetical protein VEK07_08685 [Polyangiaceae bacterium]|nr:hypothetical protein [Polyangiaceae bacterium]